MMVGRDLSSFYKKSHRFKPNAAPVLEVRGIGDGRRVHDVSFDLHAGEVLGLAGLVGAGRTEMARMLFGADRAHHGRGQARRQARARSARPRTRSTSASST